MELVQGTLDVMILKSLQWGPCHGYAVSRWIKQTTDEVLTVEEGALYPALHRLQRKGLVASEWGVSENNRRAKFYELTAKGRTALEEESRSWTRYARAVDRVLGAETPGGEEA